MHTTAKTQCKSIPPRVRHRIKAPTGSLNKNKKYHGVGGLLKKNKDSHENILKREIVDFDTGRYCEMELCKGKEVFDRINRNTRRCDRIS